MHIQNGPANPAAQEADPVRRISCQPGSMDHPTPPPAAHAAHAPDIFPFVLTRYLSSLQRPDAAATTGQPSSSALAPPPPGPSKTFTIDIPIPAANDIATSFEHLRLTHEQTVDRLVPHVFEGEEDEEEEEEGGRGGNGWDMDHDWLDQASGTGSVRSHTSSLPVGASALSTPPSSVTAGAPPQQQRQQQRQPPLAEAAEGDDGPAKQRGRTLASMRLQPQFNVDSAGKLLSTFRDVMLDHFHCVVVRESDTIATMARERPFVLLAILAVASSSRTLQGHSLYDEEFRKMLGLKFVAEGERSLEMLQGLVIFIAW